MGLYYDPDPEGDRSSDGSLPWKGKIFFPHSITSDVQVFHGPEALSQGDVLGDGLC